MMFISFSLFPSCFETAEELSWFLVHHSCVNGKQFALLSQDLKLGIRCTELFYLGDPL